MKRDFFNCRGLRHRRNPEFHYYLGERSTFLFDSSVRTKLARIFRCCWQSYRPVVSTSNDEAAGLRAHHLAQLEQHVTLTFQFVDITAEVMRHRFKLLISIADADTVHHLLQQMLGNQGPEVLSFW